jgi:hypothetical protein
MDREFDAMMLQFGITDNDDRGCLTNCAPAPDTGKRQM